MAQAPRTLRSPTRWPTRWFVAGIEVSLRVLARCPGEVLARVLPRLAWRLVPVVQRMADAGHSTEREETIQALRAVWVASLGSSAGNLIPSMALRERAVLNTWEFQNQEMHWEIPEGSRVLDVGSGGWPFHRATHLTDKFPDRTTHRVEALARDDRPFYASDLEQLPFPDKAFDFVFCSHVLEHMDNPGVAMRELMRVATCGFIEVPTRLSDVLFNFTQIPNHHRWHGLVRDNTVILIEWAVSERRQLGNVYFEALQCERQTHFQEFFERNRDLFFASLRWNQSFEFIVINKHGLIIDTNKEDL